MTILSRLPFFFPARKAPLAVGDPDTIADRLFSELGRRWQPLTEQDEARIVIEDALTVLDPASVADVLGGALLDLYGPSFTEEVGSALGLAAHMRSRADLDEVLRCVEGA